MLRTFRQIAAAALPCAGFFLDAYSRACNVDLAVFPVVSDPPRAVDFACRRVASMKIFAHAAFTPFLALLVR